MPNNTLEVYDALNEFFKLKYDFELELSNYKRNIIFNNSLSKKEKRSAFLKLMPKCINCKRPSKKGTIFSITFNETTEDFFSHRKFKCICGNLTDPCNLNIEIIIGDYEKVYDLMEEMKKEINNLKNEIIDDKNKLLFGLITTEMAIERFESNKTDMNNATLLYENYFNIYHNTIDNPKKNEELNNSMLLLYENISKIKECMKQMNETNNSQFAIDAANIYINVLQPLLVKIRTLKYSETGIYYNHLNSTYHLIQEKTKLSDLLIPSILDKVVHFELGFTS